MAADHRRACSTTRRPHAPDASAAGPAAVRRCAAVQRDCACVCVCFCVVVFFVFVFVLLFVFVFVFVLLCFLCLFFLAKILRDPGSNQGPPDLQSGALPTELSRKDRFC